MSRAGWRGPPCPPRSRSGANPRRSPRRLPIRTRASPSSRSSSANPAAPRRIPSLLKALKREVRRGEAQMRRAHEALLSSLAHRECGPRSHAVAVFDELFHRSAQFRARTLDRLDLFLKRAVGTDPDQHPMPGPAAETDALVSRAVRALDGWNAKFGPHLLDSPSRLDSSPTCSARTRQPREKPPRVATPPKPPGEKTPGRSNDGDASRRTRYRLCVATRATAPPPWKSAYARCWRDRDDLVADEVDDDDDGEDVAFESDGGVVDCAATPVRANGDVPNARIDQGAVGFDDRCLVASSTIAVAETEANAAALDELEGLCRAAARRLVPALVAALALRARRGRGGVASHPRNARTPSTFSGGEAKARGCPRSVSRRRGGRAGDATRRGGEEYREEREVRSAEEQEAAATGAAARGPNDETSDGGMRITVAGVASPRDEEDAALVAAAAAREDHRARRAVGPRDDEGNGRDEPRVGAGARVGEATFPGRPSGWVAPRMFARAEAAGSVTQRPGRRHR